MFCHRYRKELQDYQRAKSLSDRRSADNATSQVAKTQHQNTAAKLSGHRSESKSGSRKVFLFIIWVLIFGMGFVFDSQTAKKQSDPVFDLFLNDVRSDILKVTISCRVIFTGFLFRD